MGVSEVDEQEVQLVPAPKQVAQVALQSRHTPRPSAELRNLPSAHADEHVPALGSKLAPAKHEVQLPAPLPLHVRHDASHVSHVLLPLAYLLLGHEATHEPSSKYLVLLVGQVRHDDELAPLHVAQEE